MEDCAIVQDVLAEYEKASSQIVNYDKSVVMFSPNIDEVIHNNICSMLQVKATSDQERYLRLPSLIGRDKQAILRFIKDKM